MVVHMVVLEETLINRFLPRVSLCDAWTVLLFLIRTTLLIIESLQAPGTKFVLTFRTPRGLGPLFESIVELAGLIVMTPILGPRVPSFPLMLSIALFALIFVMKTLIPLLALC